MPAFSKYATYAVAVSVSPHGVFPMLYNAIDENGFPFSPVCPCHRTNAVEAFAMWWRVITFYLSEGNWRYVFDNNMLNPFEESFGKLGTSYTDEDRVAFNRVVSQYNTLRDEQMGRKTMLHAEILARYTRRIDGPLAIA